MRTRLFLSFAAIVFVSIASLVIFTMIGTAREVRSFMTNTGMISQDELEADLIAYYRARGSWQGIEEVLPEIRGAHMHQMMGNQGGRRRMGQNNNEAMATRLRVVDAQGILWADTAGGQTGVMLAGADLELALRLQDQGETIGYLLDGSGQLLSDVQESQLLIRLNSAALLSALVAGSFAIILGLLLANRLQRPVNALTVAALKLAKGDLSQRVREIGGDELSTLGRAFNHMADALQDVEAGRRAMTADIAHELRTPLSVQRAHLEALEDGIYPLTLENLQPIIAQNGQLNRLVEDLRTLALADTGQLNLDRLPTNLPDLVRSILERFKPQADARQVRLLFDAQESSPQVNVDAGRIEQILGNLLSNALRHTPDGGIVEIRVEQKGDNARLVIHDSGPGLTSETLEHIFERFYRGEKSRSRAEGGSGLGLSIAQQLARLHGGDLQAENHPQGGASFALTLPVSNADLTSS